jgi:hypothetical protein
MTANTKTWMLWGALLITLWLVWKSEPVDDAGVVMPTRNMDSHLSVEQSESSQSHLVFIARQHMPSLGNLFTTPFFAPAETLKKAATKPNNNI